MEPKVEDKSDDTAVLKVFLILMNMNSLGLRAVPGPLNQTDLPEYTEQE